MQNNLALISLPKIRSNAQKIRASAGRTPLFAVVKDDAYGHGAEEVALALEEQVCGFAVASLDEGAALRVAGVSKDILVLTPVLSEEEALRACAYGLILTVSSLATLHILLRAKEAYSLFPRVHIAVNTGMNRYGFRAENLVRACREMKDAGLFAEGIYSHLYAPEDGSAREQQTERFAAACSAAKRYFPDAVRHLSATGGILAGEKYRFDAVRSGIALYGYLPRGFEGALCLSPAMKVYSHVVQSGTFTGGGVGYAAAEREYGALSTLRLGYGDGFFRAGGLGGIGKLCMDAYIREGAGRAGQKRLVLRDAEEYARRHGTISYEVLCRIGGRAEKVYER